MNSPFSQKNTFFSIIILLIILLRCAIVLMPVVSTTVTNQTINISSLLLLFFAILVNGQRLTSSEWGNSIMVCAILLLQTISAIFSDSGEIVVRFYVFMQFLLWPLLGFFVVRNFTIKQQTFVVGIVISMIAITMITTYIGCLQYPGITRHLATPNSLETGMREIAGIQNIGGFEFVYTATLITPLVVFFFKKGNLLRMAISIVLLAMIFNFVTITGYTTALFVFIASLFLFMMPGENQRLFFIKLIIIVFFLFILSKLLLSDLLMNASQIIDNNDISVRLNEVSKILSGEELEATEDTASRFKLWGISLSGFFNNILFGTNIIGGHSYIFDNMALFGIFGLIALYLSYKGILFCLVKTNSTEYSATYGYRIFIYGLNIFLCLFNTVNFIFITTFFYPVLFNVYKSRLNEIETGIFDDDTEEYD